MTLPSSVYSTKLKQYLRLYTEHSSNVVSRENQPYAISQDAKFTVYIRIINYLAHRWISACAGTFLAVRATAGWRLSVKTEGYAKLIRDIILSPPLPRFHANRATLLAGRRLLTMRLWVLRKNFTSIPPPDVIHILSPES